MTTVTALEARRQLGKLLNIVSIKHEDILIERAGKPIARLCPCDSGSAEHQGKQNILNARGLGKELWADIDVEKYVAGERKGWD